LKRRSKADSQKIKEFREKLKEIWDPDNLDHIINADETPWRYDEKGKTTWAPIGSEGIIIDGDEKECFTLIGGISASYQLIPPIFIAAGKTHNVERNWFGESHPIDSCNKDEKYLTDHTKSGWTTRESWARYICFLRKLIPDNPDLPSEKNKIYLVCDKYPPHVPANQSTTRHRGRRRKQPIEQSDDQLPEQSDDQPPEQPQRRSRGRPRKIQQHRPRGRPRKHPLVPRQQRSQGRQPKKPDPVEAACSKYNVEILLVPEGTTDLCQPLDCRFFGAFKCHAQAIIDEKETQNLVSQIHGNRIDPNFKKLELTRPQIREILINSYYDTKRHLIEDSWIKALDLDES